MIDLILNVIKNDAQIISLISPTVSNPKIFEIGTKYLGDCIVYTYNELLDDGIRSQDRLELTVNSTSSTKARQIINRLKQILVTVADSQKVNGILEISQSGGGGLYDEVTNVFKRKAFFIVKSKSKIKI